MEKQELKSVGTTVYLECQKGSDATGYGFLQIFFTPQGMTAAGANVPVTMIHRQVTTVRSRSTWKHRPARLMISTGALVAPSAAYDAAMTAMIHDGKGSFGHVIQQLARFGYSAQRSPIYVETTIDDLAVIASRKTPYGLLTRINKSRKQLNWPADVWTPVKAGV